jgi:hypothetical protein
MKADVEESRPLPRKGRNYRAVITLGALLLFFWTIIHSDPWRAYYSPSSLKLNVAAVQQCAIDNLKLDLSFLDDAKPIGADEFLERRDRLAQALAVNGVDAFVFEPGYTFQ